MKTILDKDTLEGLIARIKTLQASNTPEWGSMDVGRMINHCIAWEEMVAGKIESHRIFLGRIFGKIALKSMIGTDEPVKRNLPTLPELKMTVGVQNFEAGKSKWIALLEQNANSPNNNFIHPFFGKMTIKQIGILSYKHNDHHLRQFNK